MRYIPKDTIPSTELREPWDMYAIVTSAQNEEQIVQKLRSAEDAHRQILQLLEHADENDGEAAAEVLFRMLRVETLH